MSDPVNNGNDNLVTIPSSQVLPLDPVFWAQEVITSFEGLPFDVANSALEIAANLLAFRVRTQTWKGR